MRGRRRIRCAGCGLSYVCICDSCERVESELEIILLVHPEEYQKPSGTGKLIGHCLRSSRYLIWSRELSGELHSLLTDPKRACAVADPSGVPLRDFVRDHTPDYRARRPVVIMLDGTWKQARKMYRRNEYLKPLPLVSLSEVSNSRYTLRTQHALGNLSTIETAIAFLRESGDFEPGALLESHFQKFLDYYHAIRQSRLQRASVMK